MAKQSKLRNRQAVIDELAKAMAEGYAARVVYRELEEKQYTLQRELEQIINQEVTK